jgi:hypothetical protein
VQLPLDIIFIAINQVVKGIDLFHCVKPPLCSPRPSWPLPSSFSQCCRTPG